MTEGTDFWIGASTAGVLGGVAAGIRPLAVEADGTWSIGEATDVGPNPMYLEWSEGVGVLTIVHEQAEGLVSAWSLGGGVLRPIDGPGRTAAGPCHLLAGPDGQWLFVANYAGGALTAHFLGMQGAGDAAVTVAYTGSGPVADRQGAPHPHQCVVDAARGTLLVPDLGTDRIHVHSLDAIPDSLADYRDIVIHPGAGPRHLVIDGNLAIVANELDRTASIVDLVRGEELWWGSIGDAEPRGLGCSGIRQTRTGVVLIGDRDHDAIRAFRLVRDAAGPRLEALATLATGGRHPRDLQLTEDERYLLVADQGSDSIAILALDEAGVPVRVHDTVSTPAPACVMRMPW
ncbi:lactonase family protein [Agromyces archimandritae]|uniref:Beta-propeller fold lactonase family protein n=1 Tax=Agromyces archimandritae TaxID=2781962 RepID=A0A975IN91_9MICO|nr:beta-propeller fold lactonase family protein [Agromyces archimandritae]QTX04009.1 beta-propeller fold lactonase family protein [Agromyces archimandritae]